MTESGMGRLPPPGSPAELRDRLAAARQELLATVALLTDAEWDQPTANPEWTARDLLAHLAAAEPGLLERMRSILAGRSALPANFDLSLWNRRQVSRRRGTPVSDLLASLADSRRAMLDFLDQLSPDQLAVRGYHASGREMSVAEIVAIAAQHERDHARDIRSAHS
jgi:uncharacterized protein (TIGR03083 family)